MEKLKTRRGVFINLDNSDITYKYGDKVYKFTSETKRNIFIDRCLARKNFVLANFAKLVNSKCYGIKVDLKDTTIEEAKQKIIDCIYDTVYDTMLYR